MPVTKRPVLRAETAYGTFSRKTDHAYTHIVVVLPNEIDILNANERAAQTQERLAWARTQPQVEVTFWNCAPRPGYIATSALSHRHISSFEKDARDATRWAAEVAAIVAQGHGRIVSWHGRRDLAEKAAAKVRTYRSYAGRTVLVLPVSQAVAA